MRIKSGKVLLAFMEDQGKSFGDVGRYAGCDRSFIWQLAREKRTTCKPLIAQRIAELLGVPLEVLFDVRVMPSGSDSIVRRKKAAA